MENIKKEISNLKTMDEAGEMRDHLFHLYMSSYLTHDEYNDLMEDLDLECSFIGGRPVPTIDDDDWEEMKMSDPDLSDQ